MKLKQLKIQNSLEINFMKTLTYSLKWIKTITKLSCLIQKPEVVSTK